MTHFVKSLFLYSWLLLLSACATTNSYHDRKIACEAFASDLGHNKDWIGTCQRDDLTFNAAFEDNLKRLSPEKLCNIGFISNDSAAGQAAERTAKTRGINCSPFYREFSKNIVKLDALKLCAVWHQNLGPQELREAVRKEVKERDADCPALIAAHAQQEQAEAQRAQAAAMIGANIQNSINANRPRTCYSYGASVTCY